MTNEAVADVIVVGIPDERWGEQVVAVVAGARGETPTLEALQQHARDSLAGYKLPRALVLVDKVERTPAGKPDYAWAKKIAMAEGS
jgi:acyl-CoA synthetase (AMP-forming)/AMP-acid ligase II